MKKNVIITLVGIGIILIAGIAYMISQFSSSVPSPSPSPVIESPSPLPSPTPNQNTASFTDPKRTVSFDFPKQFTVSGIHGTPSQDWKQNTTSTGVLEATLVIPRSFEPQTNFSEARFTVGDSDAPQALAQCGKEKSGSPIIAASQTTINGTTFTKTTYGDAAAGNYYEVTSYQTIHSGRCYAIEYVIHSTNLQNYPPESGISQFDKAKIQAILEGIVQSFKFL